MVVDVVHVQRDEFPFSQRGPPRWRRRAAARARPGRRQPAPAAGARSASQVVLGPRARVGADLAGGRRVQEPDRETARPWSAAGGRGRPAAPASRISVQDAGTRRAAAAGARCRSAARAAARSPLEGAERELGPARRAARPGPGRAAARRGRPGRSSSRPCSSRSSRSSGGNRPPGTWPRKGDGRAPEHREPLVQGRPAGRARPGRPCAMVAAVGQPDSGSCQDEAEIDVADQRAEAAVGQAAQRVPGDQPIAERFGVGGDGALQHGLTQVGRHGISPHGGRARMGSACMAPECQRAPATAGSWRPPGHRELPPGHVMMNADE